MGNSNSNEQSEAFYKYRGVAKSLSAGISFLTDNFRYILRISLSFAIAFALIQAILSYITSNASMLQLMVGGADVMDSSRIMLLVMMVVLLALLFVVSCLFSGLIYRLIHIHSHDLPLRRFGYVETLKTSARYGLKAGAYYAVMMVVAVVCTVVVVLPVFIPTEGNIYLGIKLGASALLYVAFLVFALPVSVSLPAYFLERGNPVKCAWYGYRKGMRIWGKLFCMALLIGLLEMVIVGVLSLPSLTLMSSYRAATLSQLNGDVVSIPSTFELWYAIVLFITSYLFTFILWIGPASFSYMYASIKSDEKEAEKISLSTYR